MQRGLTSHSNLAHRGIFSEDLFQFGEKLYEHFTKINDMRYSMLVVKKEKIFTNLEKTMDLGTFLEINRYKPREFATLIGVNPHSINNYLAGRSLPSARITVKIEIITHGAVKLKDLMRHYMTKQAEMRNKKQKRDEVMHE